MSLSGSVVEDAIERNSWGGGRPDVNRCVASQTPEDFTAHVEMHPLKHHCQHAVELFLSSVCLFCGVTIEFPCAE